MIPFDLAGALQSRKKFVEENDDNTVSSGRGGGCSASGSALMNLRSPNETGMSFMDKSSTGLTGLINQGATCYLNSLLQTLYSLKDLKNSFYCSDFSSNEASRDLCRQLQRLFVELDVSVRGAVSTSSLTKSFGWSARDSFQQQDVQECMTVIFEFIQVSYPLSPVAEWMEKNWKGTILSSLVCENCLCERSKRSERFRDLQLQVKGMETLTNSLSAYFQDEELEGVDCEACGGRHNHSQKKSLKEDELPMVLTIQLRRFDMDWNTFQRVKVYDALDIDQMLHLDRNILSTPSHLEEADNQRQHIIEGDKSNPCYELVSVMMHSGSAFSGHYFCYIKSSQGKWTLFNDSNVTALSDDEVHSVFSSSSAKNDTAATTEKTNTNNDASDNENKSNKSKKHPMLLPVNRHAYMLVYRRRCETPVDCGGDNCLAPLDVVEEVQRDNVTYLEAKKKFLEEREYLHVTVHRSAPSRSSSSPISPAAKVFRIHEGNNLRQLTDMVHEALFVDEEVGNNVIMRDQIRIRVHDMIKGVGLPAASLFQSLSFDSPDSTVGLSQIEAESFVELRTIDESVLQKYLYVEINHRQSGEPEFQPLVDGDYSITYTSITAEELTVQLHLYCHNDRDLSSSSSFFPPVETRLTVGATWQTWSDAIYSVISRNLGDLRDGNPVQEDMVLVSLVEESEGTVTRPRAVVIADNSMAASAEMPGSSMQALRDSLSETGVKMEDKTSFSLFVDFQESDEIGTSSSPSSSSKMLRCFDKALNEIDMIVTVKTTAEVGDENKVELSMDGRLSLNEAKHAISQACEWPIQSFRFISGEGGDVIEIKDLSSVLNVLVSIHPSAQARQIDGVANCRIKKKNGVAVRVPLLHLTVENKPPLNVGQLRVQLFLKATPNMLSIDVMGVEVDKFISLKADDSSDSHNSRGNAFVFHQDDTIKNIKSEIWEQFRQGIVARCPSGGIEGVKDPPIRLQLVTQKTLNVDSTPPSSSQRTLKATIVLSDDLTFSQCMETKKGSPSSSVFTEALCLTVEGVTEQNFNRESDMLLALWEWFPVSCRSLGDKDVRGLKKHSEVVVAQSSSFGDIKKIILANFYKEGECDGKMLYFAKPFHWQLHTSPEENIPLLKWGNQPESDESTITGAPLRIQANTRSKHMGPPVLLFKRCLPSQLIEVVETDAEGRGDSNDGSETSALQKLRNGKGRRMQPEADGFKLFTPAEQEAKQKEDDQLAKDRQQAIKSAIITQVIPKN